MRYIARGARRAPRRRHYYRKRNDRRRPARFLFFALIVILLAVFSEFGLSSVSQDLTEEAAKKYINTAVNEAVQQELQNAEENTYTNIVRDDSGKIVSVTADTVQLNQFKAGLAQRISKKLNGKASIGIPVGSLTDVALFNGRGFHVPLKLSMEGTADILIETEFESAGINQSCHRISVVVRTSVVSQSKRFAVSTENETNFVLSETVIVGSVPSIITG